MKFFSVVSVLVTFFVLSHEQGIGFHKIMTKIEGPTPSEASVWETKAVSKKYPSHNVHSDFSIIENPVGSLKNLGRVGRRNDEAAPDDWTCHANYYRDYTYCNCNCGYPDPDCSNSNLPMYGCPLTTSTCSDSGKCINFAKPNDWSCDSDRYGDGICDCGCGYQDIDCTIKGLFTKQKSCGGSSVLATSCSNNECTQREVTSASQDDYLISKRYSDDDCEELLFVSSNKKGCSLASGSSTASYCSTTLPIAYQIYYEDKNACKSKDYDVEVTNYFNLSTCENKRIYTCADEKYTDSIGDMMMTQFFVKGPVQSMLAMIH